jgi:hypothetical protein
MTLSAMEFLRRFVQHILPRGFVRIRQSGFLANTCRTARVALARTLLASPTPATPSAPTTAVVTPHRDRRRVGLPTLRRRHDRWPDPFGPPPGVAHARLRHLMNARLSRHDRRLRRRGHPRVRRGAPRSAATARHITSAVHTPDRRDACRRRSRAGGPLIDH